MRKVWTAIAAILAAIFVITFLDRFVLARLLFERTWLAVLFAGLEALALIGAGWLVRRMRGRIAENLIIGYPVFGTVCFLVGLLRISPAIMLPLLVIFGAIGVWSMWIAASGSSRTDSVDEVTTSPAPLHVTSASEAFGLVAIACVLFAGFVAAQAPPSSLDELAYHLAIPHSWVVEGRAIDLPLISHSYFPLGIESADLPLLVALGPVSGGIASHFLHLIVAIATLVIIWRSTKRNLLLTAAIAATPALALIAGWSLVDWPLLGLFVLLADALDGDGDDATLAAVIGAGMLTKYTFLPFAVVMLVVAKRWRGVLPGVAIGSVFFIRNLVLTANPFAPFFSANAPHVSAYRELVLSSYIFDGRFIDESLGGSLLSSSVFTLGPAGFAALILGAFLFALAPSARILVPFFGVAAARANEAFRASRILRVAVAVTISVQLLLVAYFVDRTQPFALMSGKWSEGEYLQNVRSSFAAIEWINSRLKPGTRTLVVGLNETYWFAYPVRGGGNFDGPRVSAYLDMPTSEALHTKLIRDGVTHVAVFGAVAPNTNVAQKVAERQTLLTKSAQRSLAQMLDMYASNIESHPSVTLFTLK